MFDLAVPHRPWLALALVALAAGAATWAGGALALRVRGRIRLILGFSAGAVIAVALADLLPEALELAGGARPHQAVFAWVIGAFAGYLILDRLLQALSGGQRGHRGHLGAASLTVHSFLDGLGVGLAFQVSVPAGMVLAFAVLAHDLSDGVNTVSLGLQARGGPRVAERWLIADAAAPAIGILVAQFIHVGQAQLALLLAAFAGVFLYIGAVQLLPESHEQHPRPWTTIATVVGMVVIYAAVRLAAHT